MNGWIIDTECTNTCIQYQHKTKWLWMCHDMQKSTFSFFSQRAWRALCGCSSSVRPAQLRGRGQNKPPPPLFPTATHPRSRMNRRTEERSSGSIKQPHGEIRSSLWGPEDETHCDITTETKRRKPRVCMCLFAWKQESLNCRHVFDDTTAKI